MLRIHENLAVFETVRDTLTLVSYSKSLFGAYIRDVTDHRDKTLPADLSATDQ